MVSTAGAGLKVLTDSGDWVSVPLDLGEKETALVSAVVHPCPNFFIWARKPEQFGLAPTPRNDTESPLPMHSLLDRLWDILQQDGRGQPSLSELVQSVPPQLLESVPVPETEGADVLWLWPTEAGWDWPDDRWLERLGAGGLGERLLSAVVKYVEAARVRSVAEGRDRESQDQSPEVRRVVGALADERGRQLLAMTEAMGRFLEAVHP